MLLMLLLFGVVVLLVFRFVWVLCDFGFSLNWFVIINNYPRCCFWLLLSCIVSLGDCVLSVTVFFGVDVLACCIVYVLLSRYVVCC